MADTDTATSTNETEKRRASGQNAAATKRRRAVGQKVAAPRMKASKSASRDQIATQIQKIVDRVKRELSQPPKVKLPKYEDHVVCFMDLMGFRHRVERMSIADSRKEIAKLEALIQKVVAPSSMGAGDVDGIFRITANYFSDCICFACSIGSVDLKWVVEKLYYFVLHILQVQGELILHDVLIRGAITVDKHYASERLIFSKAQVRAYDLESKHVVFPMVYIDDSVLTAVRRAARRKQKQPYPWGINALKSELGDLFGLWAEDEDGRRFVNYLGFWRELDSEYDVRPFFAQHKKLIESGAKRFRNKPDILAKYRWMARYHDVYTMKMFPNNAALRIDGSAFGAITLPEGD